MKLITAKNAPEALGPYSHGVLLEGVGDENGRSPGLLFTSGQLGLIPATGKLVSGLKEQTQRALENIESILHASGLNKSHVVKTTIFVTDISGFPDVNEIYGNFFSPHKPARSTVEVSALPLGAEIEIEAIASSN